jgi:hypothetical protein
VTSTNNRKDKRPQMLQIIQLCSLHRVFVNAGTLYIDFAVSLLRRIISVHSILLVRTGFIIYIFYCYPTLIPK